MERRDFLKAGALAGGSLGLGAAGCGAVLEGMSAVPVPSVAELQALDMDGYLKRLDTSLGFIQSTSSLDSIVPKGVQLKAREEPRFARADELVRKTLRSALLAGSFSDLSEAGRAHPGMQERMWSSMQEMDDVVFGMNDVLTSLTPTERADMSRLMREDATLGPRVLDAIDAEGVRAGVNDRRRDHLRQVGKHVMFRMRQSTSLLIDDCGETMKKVAARDASVEAVQRRLMAQMGEKAFWEHHARQTALMQAWQGVPGIAQAGPSPGVPPPPGAGPTPGLPPLPATATAAAIATASGAWAVGAPAAPVASAPAGSGGYVVYPYVAPPPPVTDGKPQISDEEKRERRRNTGTKLLTVGGILFGLGAIAGGISIAMESSGNSGLQFGGLFVITAAVLLGIGGLTCLIIGGIFRGLS